MVNSWKWMGAALTVCVMAGCQCPWMHKKAAEKAMSEEGPEVKVPFAQVPAAAQATLTKEAQGAAIKDVDKEMVKGKTAYEADAMIGTMNYEIVVGEDGTLISKKVDTEVDEKGAAGAKAKDENKQTGEHED